MPCPIIEDLFRGVKYLRSDEGGDSSCWTTCGCLRKFGSGYDIERESSTKRTMGD